MQQAAITFLVRATGPDLHFTVILDGQIVQEFEPTLEDKEITVSIDDDLESEHCLSLLMRGKHMDHTKVDEQGQILEDRVIEISDVRIDGIELGHVFTQTAKYTHDRNGTADATIEPFYGIMGCNGQADFRFSTPVYLWLLENM